MPLGPIGPKILQSCTNTRRHPEHGTRNRLQRLNQIYNTLIKNELLMRLGFLVTELY